ncbi:MAG: hypothetical protein EXQ52_11760 [Bryobacterales bacterium]|nr:hypothetical protein [Bryobacterales bacterium]
MSKNESLQRAWHRYDRDHEHLPTSTRQAFEWAVAEGLLELPQIDPYDLGAEQMAQALRAEIRTDEQGRRYRVNHAVRATKGGVQYTFWGVLGFAPHSHMERAFAQRREQIIGDCLQLKTDVDVYNDKNAGKMPQIQLVLNFEDDVAERQQLEIMSQRKNPGKRDGNKEAA